MRITTHRELLSGQPLVRFQFVHMDPDETAWVELTNLPGVNLYRSEKTGQVTTIELSAERLREFAEQAERLPEFSELTF